MTIILMLVFVIAALAVGTKIGWMFGVPLVAFGLWLAVEAGSASWRKRQEDLFWFIGLAGIAFGAIATIFNW
ncbi:hypothetical protein [Paraferrimonas sedimenticola]|uniref:Uncharacterized protein n=1 Tax=Paraferrimonas sedimenticola TaxID=375674 RepID=A0AA37RVE6_9GAMM|nr:hypothetical protein [Paraferrimonas sedimenticola]GLP95272.1 hypothetical protein GCM10007895_05780 [Paraferrimonas sedimenticola]